MAAKRQSRRVTNEYRTYVDGNTVRKAAAAAPGPRRREERRERGQTVDRVVRRNRAKALYMDAPYVMALTIAAVCTLFLCIHYLQLQSSITGKVKEIASVEKEIENLKAENDAVETSIKTSVDLDYVYKVATQELGMVYANEGQVRLYNKTESEYVRQNEEIPKY